MKEQKKVHVTQNNGNLNVSNQKTDVAPCIAHPCDSPGGGFACRNCAFSRENVSATAAGAKEVVASVDYGCRIGGSIFAGPNGSIFMKVGNNIFPEASAKNNYVTDAQQRLRNYLGQ